MSSEEGNTDQMRMLIVDDNPDFREAMRMLLPRRFKVEVVDVLEAADQALAYAEIASIDLVMVDFKMPGINGLAFTQVMTQRENHPKILLASFNPMPALREAAIKAGAVDLICKSEIQEGLAMYLPPL
jgi:DNA-binding NarL/FixJ family response regulator